MVNWTKAPNSNLANWKRFDCVPHTIFKSPGYWVSSRPAIVFFFLTMLNTFCPRLTTHIDFEILGDRFFIDFANSAGPSAKVYRCKGLGIKGYIRACGDRDRGVIWIGK